MTRTPCARRRVRPCRAFSAPIDGVLDFAQARSSTARPSRTSLAAIRTRQSATRTVGWEARHPGWSGGQSCSDATIGHTGFTGTGLWIDFAHGIAWSLLTNRVHPSRHRETGIVSLRPATGDLVFARRA